MAGPAGQEHRIPETWGYSAREPATGIERGRQVYVQWCAICHESGPGMAGTDGLKRKYKGELPALPGEKPTLSDWADHLTTIFPEARIKKFIEMRGADGGPWRRLCALPAFWVGLMYDQSALDAAWDMVKGWDAETRDALRVAASVDGLAAKVNGVSMQDLAARTV